MSTMTISPLQPMRQDYVTKGEFIKFETKVDDGLGAMFDHMDTIEGEIDSHKKDTDKKLSQIDRRFDEQKAYIDDGFGKVFKQLNAVESGLSGKIENLSDKFSDLSKEVEGISLEVRGMAQQITGLTESIRSKF